MQVTNTIYFEILEIINSLKSSSNIEQLNHKLAYIDGALFVSQFLLNDSELNYLYQLKEHNYDLLIKEISQ